MSYLEASDIRKSSAPRSSTRYFARWASVCALIVVDSLAVLGSYLVFRQPWSMASLTWSIGNSVPSAGGGGIDVFLLFGAFFVLISALIGDYGRRQLFWDGARTTTRILSFLMIPDLFLSLVIGGRTLFLPALASWAFLLLAVPLFRQGVRRALTKAGLWKIPTAVLGNGPHASEAIFALNNSLSLGFDIRYLLAIKDDADVADALSHLRRIHVEEPAQMVAKLHERGCDQIVIAEEDFQAPHVGEIIQRLVGSEIGIVIIPFMRGLPLFGLNTSFVFGKDILLLQIRNNLARLPSRLTKAATDFFGPIVLLILFSPLLLIFALAIKLQDGGPVFFVQRRVGRNGKEFECFKFRTMGVHAEEILEKWRESEPAKYQEYVACNFKLKNDPRITRVGRWLRRTSLDELPQLLNVFFQDMSLVGPRPLLAREIPDYGPGFDLYCRVRPGMTGLWQISGRSETTFSDRVAYDEWYIMNWSFWADIVILIQTAKIIFSKEGAY
jgi:undecaprenyl-phosphate galactose phosphotransferase